MAGQPTAFSEQSIANATFDPVTNTSSVSQGTRIDPNNDGITTYPYGHSYTAISTATTTVIRTGAGVLDRIIVTGGTTGTIVIYDNVAASGTKIADFDTTNALANYVFNAAFATGLTIITSAATKITVIWRPIP